MGWPLFRNGKILLCRGGLASTCCQSVLKLEISGTGVYHIGDSPLQSSAGSGAYVAVELYDDNGNRVGACGDTSHTIAITGQRTFTLRFYMMAWHGNEGCDLDDFTVGVAGTINNNAGSGGSASMDLSGCPTSTASGSGTCSTPANGKSFTIVADETTETVTIT